MNGCLTCDFHCCWCIWVEYTQRSDKLPKFNHSIAFYIKEIEDLHLQLSEMKTKWKITILANQSRKISLARNLVDDGIQLHLKILKQVEHTIPCLQIDSSYLCSGIVQAETLPENKNHIINIKVEYIKFK